MLCDLAARPRETAAEHTIALMTPNEELARLFVATGLRVLDRGRVGESPGAYLWRSLGPQDVAWLAEVMTRERADVAHLHTFGSQVVGTRAARRAGVRILRTEHSTRVYDDPTCWPFSRWSLRRTDRVVAISRHVLDVALKRAGWIRDHAQIIHNGVDAERFAPGTGGGAGFCLVGRLEPRKGVDVAIDAIAEVPGATLDVVGDGELRCELEARAGPRVRFHGQLSDVRPVVLACAAVVCSSRNEGLGIALLEGMAMGKPVVAVPVGGVPEIVEDGVNGFLAPDGSPSALAKAMRRALEDPERLAQMGRAARARVEERFSIRAMCAAYAEAYARLLSTRGSASP
jgi:glycosyltransferase involved in cell wall biosynthesis